jgi:hypothetical protein
MTDREKILCLTRALKSLIVATEWDKRHLLLASLTNAKNALKKVQAK